MRWLTDLPRVRHWIQNQSFAHYPTHSLHQISLPFVAGYPVAHLQLLSGGDRFASLPQWAAFLGCIIVAASLARRLFGGRAAVPAAVACATVPMAVLQASNAQSDLVTSFWLLCFVRLLCERRPYRAADVVWMGAALDSVSLRSRRCCCSLRRFSRSSRCARRAPGGAAVWAYRSPSCCLRCCRGCPTLSATCARSGTRSVPIWGCRCNATTPERSRPTSCGRRRSATRPSIYGRASRGCTRTSFTFTVSDPATTAALTGFVPRTARVFLNPDENQVASPVHVTLALVAGVAALRAARRRRGGWASRRIQLPVAIGVAFLLFCAAIRWQPWANRLLLPLLLLATPLVGSLLANAATRIRLGLTCALVALAMLYGLSSVRHPWIARHEAPSLSLRERTRDQLYFAEDELPSVGRKLRASYEELSRRAARDRCSRIGLISGDDEPEYLVWARRPSAPVARRRSATSPSRTPPAPLPNIPRGHVRDRHAPRRPRRLHGAVKVRAWRPTSRGS